MPPVTQVLIFANIAVYLLESGGMPLVDTFALWPPAFGPDMVSGFAPWQLVTYGFLHGNLGHIFFNMFGLYMFGSAVELLFGARFFLGYYFASVVAAALTHIAVITFLGGSGAPLVGASGGVFGLLLAYGWYFPQRTVLLIIPPIPMRARTFVAVYAVLELYFGVTGTASGIAHFAHLGGMLGGWLMILYRRAGPPRRPG